MPAGKILMMFAIFLSLGPLIYSQDIHSPENRLKFGNQLYSEKDYLRAIGEYNEYLKTNDNDTVRYKIAEAYFRMDKYPQAEDNYKSLFSSYTLQDEAKFGLIKATFFRGDFDFLRQYSLKSPYFTPKYEMEIKRLINITYLLDTSTNIEPLKVVAVFPSDAQTTMLDLLEMKLHPNYKDPTLATVLSVFVPGLGKAYCKQYTDGIIAFVGTGLSIIFAVNNFNSGSVFKGTVFTGLAAFFYGGSIYGSAAAAQNYNAGIKFNFENGVKVFLNSNNYFLPKDRF